MVPAARHVRARHGRRELPELTTFFDQATDHLESGGRILLSFGTTGDIDYLHHLITQSGLRREELRRVEGERDGLPVAYFAYRLTLP